MKIVSGGQTGVDRAALDVAAVLGIEVGGWCPRGRRAEDGRIPQRYLLTQTPSRSYTQRTEWNVRDSDATLILHRGPITGGTKLTVELARCYQRPLLIRDLSAGPDPLPARQWLERHRVRVLNVAGPRESAKPGIQLLARSFLLRLLAPLARR